MLPRVTPTSRDGVHNAAVFVRASSEVPETPTISPRNASSGLCRVTQYQVWVWRRTGWGRGYGRRPCPALPGGDSSRQDILNLTLSLS
jgi:hypothetical protein